MKKHLAPGVSQPLEGIPPALGLWLQTALDSSVILGGLLSTESPVQNDDSLSGDQDSDDGQGDRDEDETSTELV
jgi:hypothetical protein